MTNARHNHRVIGGWSPLARCFPDRPLASVATWRRWWPVDFRKRAFAGWTRFHRASLKRLQPEGKPEGCEPYPTDRILGGDRWVRGRTSSCAAQCVDAHLQSWRQRRDDRGAGHAGVLQRTRAARRFAVGDNGLAGSLDGWRRSPVVPAGMGRAQRMCSDVRHRRVSLGMRDSSAVLRERVLAPRRLDGWVSTSV
jgi:hypothetical protein